MRSISSIFFLYISEEKEVAQEQLNIFCHNTVGSLGISENTFIESILIASEKKKYKHHPSLITIADKISPSSFSFLEIDNDEIKVKIQKLNAEKAIPQKHISV